MNQQLKPWRRTVLLLATAAALTACSNANVVDPTVEKVRLGTLEMCPKHTVDEIVKAFMGKPSWEAGKSDKGAVFVNVSGDITFHEKPVRAVVQFILTGDRFAFNAFEMNGVPSENVIADELMEKMCAAAS